MIKLDIVCINLTKTGQNVIILKSLYRIDKNEGYSNIVLNDEIKQNREKLDNKDIGLISEIVYGVTTWRLTLDEIIKKYSKYRIFKKLKQRFSFSKSY